MKILGSKRSRFTAFLIVLIVAPIAYQQINSKFSEIMQRKANSIPKTVQTSKPEYEEIYSSSESAGRIEAKYSVDVVARINGWLQKRFFNEGAKIHKGQTLFLIEPDQYQIAVKNAEANVRQNKASLINAQKELVRAAELVKQDYVSKSYYDEALATRDRAQAALDASQAALADARLNLSYTKVTSPIDGKIGKIIITEGNLVNTTSGALARIVSVKPIYVYFTLKSSEFLKFKKVDSSADFSNMNVKIQLADGTTYAENGKIEFVNNEVDQTTGTISLRATFENADELLVPGDFVKVVVTAKTPKKVVLIPQSAALDDAQGYYVWSVDSDNKAVRKNIKVSEEIDKKWVVEEGLTPEDIFVSKGTQSIRMPGQKVNPEPLENETEANKTK